MNEKPVKVEEVDRMQMQVFSERERRIQSETAGIRMALQQLMGEKAASDVERKVFAEKMKTKYRLDPQDQIDLGTGAITHLPPPPVEAAGDPLPPPAPALKAVPPAQ